MFSDKTAKANNFDPFPFASTSTWMTYDVFIFLYLPSVGPYVYRDTGMTLCDQLNEVFRQYGVHLATTSYFISHDQQKIKAMFDRIRRLGEKGGYPDQCGPYAIKNIRDLTTGKRNQVIVFNHFLVFC